jgi:hypothetical protein
LIIKFTMSKTIEITEKGLKFKEEAKKEWKLTFPKRKNKK